MSAVSVVIPSYNRARLVGRAVRSVLAQLAPGDEVIVVDDESTDDTRAVVESFGSPVRYVRNVHRGLACGSARNRGIDESRNPLVAFLDSDDEWLPGKLPMQRALLAARPDVAFCFTEFECRCDDGRVWHAGLSHWHEDSRPWGEILGPGAPFSQFAALPAGRADFPVHIGEMYRTMLRTNYVATQSTLVRRAAFGDSIRFAEDVPIHEEYECYSRLARTGAAAFFDCETFIQWGHDGPRMSRDADGLRRAEARLKILPRIWGADTEFLQKHGEAYRQEVRNEHLLAAGLLVREGQVRPARAHLRAAGGGPLWLLVASRMPGTVLRGAMRLKQTLTGRRAAATVAMLSALATDRFRRSADELDRLAAGWA